MAPTQCSIHPDATTLHRFVLGRSPGEESERVEQHLRECDACARVAESLPGDRLLNLLRKSEPLAVVTSHEPLTDREQENSGMRSRERRSAGLLRFFGLGLVLWSLMLTGCDSRVGSVKVRDMPETKSFGLPPKPTTGTPQPPAGSGTRRKTPDYKPG